MSKGWADLPMLQYFYSKLGFTLLSFAMYRELAKESGEDIVLNVVSTNTQV